MPGSSPFDPPSHAAALSSHARLERISEPWSINRSVAIILTLVLAMVLGTWAAGGEIEKIILLGVWFAAVMIIVFVRDHWWSPALIITAISFKTTALGFPLTGLEVGLFILALTFPVKMAMKTLRKAEPEMDPGTLYWLLLGYVCIHAAVILGYNKIAGVQLKNIIKAYYSAITPLIFYGLLIRYAHARTVKPAAIALFIATFISVFFSIITMISGLDIEPFSDLQITIGWLNAYSADPILRYATVTLFVGSLAFWPVVRRGWPRFVMGFTVAMSSFGVLYSGGRLSLVTCIGAAVFFAVVRRQLWVGFPAILISLLVSATITVKPDILDEFPFTVQRALAPFNFSSQQTEVQEALVGSDEWHQVLRNESYDYWMADTGSFFIGHGFKAWDESLNDDTTSDILDSERHKEVAIEMGFTENMFSAITNIFGLTGLVLYGLFLFNLAFRLWKAISLCPPNSAARAMCEFSLVTLSATLISTFVQGGIPNITLIYWMLGLLAARPYIARGKPAPAPAAAERPAFARPAFGGQPVVSRPRRLRPGSASSPA